MRDVDLLVRDLTPAEDDTDLRNSRDLETEVREERFLSLAPLRERSLDDDLCLLIGERFLLSSPRERDRFRSTDRRDNDRFRDIDLFLVDSPRDDERFFLTGSREIERLEDAARLRDIDLFLSVNLCDTERFSLLEVDRFRDRSILITSVSLDFERRLRGLFSCLEICFSFDIERFFSV